MNNTRNSSFELLRLLSMLMIVIGHGIVHGLGFGGMSPTWNIPMLVRPSDMLLCCLVYSLCVPAVNIFILISGYFGIKPSVNKVTKLLFSLVFYSFTFGTLYYIAIGHKVQAARSLLVLSNSPYWFVIDYLFLLCFVPMINLFIEKSTKRALLLFIVSTLLISSYFGFVWHHDANVTGYTLMQFITLYCVGRYIKIYGLRLCRSKSLLILFSCLILTGILMYTMYIFGKPGYAYQMCYYNNPLLIAAGIATILLFQEIQFNSKSINRIAASSVAIYFVQSSPLVGCYQYSYIANRYINDSLSGGGVFY